MGEQGVTTGSIARASAVLSALADERDGASLSLVIARTDFTKTTAHRTLQSLQDVEYVYQDPDTRRYHLGSALGRLARQAGRSDVSAIAGRSMRRLADASEDTVFLSIPEGSEAICVRVELGAFPIRTLSLEVGDRVPLGVGATGQALYAATSQPKRLAAAAANRNWMKDFNFTPQLAEDLASDFEERGYAFNPSIVIPGMSAVALPVISKKGTLVAGLGIGAINERMAMSRVEGELVPMLRREVGHLVKRLNELEKGGLL